MKCPHCLENFHVEWYVDSEVTTNDEGVWSARGTECPNCNRPIIALTCHKDKEQNHLKSEMIVYPKASARPVAPEVPSEYSEDFVEACMVLTDSPKASAALSRRCLQNLLRGTAQVKPGDLYTEIGEVLPKLPAYLAEAVDAVRAIGNFAAHPMKSTSTGTIVPVEQGEAEWLLTVLEGLFDFYFVQPAVLKRRRTALNQKMQDIKKPAIR